MNPDHIPVTVTVTESDVIAMACDVQADMASVISAETQASANVPPPIEYTTQFYDED